ncbi:MAG: ABC transporter ATP-binding protein [Acidimicrobiia bacterium]
MAPVHALRSCNLDIAPSDYVALVGPSGSGKSTLLNVLGLLDRPTAGSYLLDGVETQRLAPNERTRLRASKIGFVFQQYHLVAHRSVTENVELGLLHRGVGRSDRRRRAIEALAEVGLDHRIDAFPATLSGGEQQRVAIARALATEVKLLLCDEPTGNLDEVSAAAVVAIFERLNRDGLTLIVVTHNASLAQRAGRIVRLSAGTMNE